MNTKKQVIIGSGFLAKKFMKYSKFIKNKNVIIYAAGISNSLEKNNRKLKKEINRFNNFIKLRQKKIVFISTCSVNDPSRRRNKYIKNKILIEKIIKKKFSNYLIIRLPEIVGFNENPHTLANFFYNKIINNKIFYLFKNTKRNLIDVEDALECCTKIINQKKKDKEIINLLNKTFYTPEKIAKTFEKILNKKINYKIKLIKKSNWTNKNNYYFKTDKKYLENILSKYYI